MHIHVIPTNFSNEKSKIPLIEILQNFLVLPGTVPGKRIQKKRIGTNTKLPSKNPINSGEE
jgi:hypothetical protein